MLVLVSMNNALVEINNAETMLVLVSMNNALVEINNAETMAYGINERFIG
jgi:hypothetical protein